MSSKLQIKVLGDLIVLRGDQQIALPQSRKTRALLAYLAIVACRQRRNYLCRMFWEDTADPRASLRWSLSKLRRILKEDGEEGRLVADNDGVSFDASGLDVDWVQIGPINPKTVNSFDTPALETFASGFRGRFLEGLDLPHCPVFEAWRRYHADSLDRTQSLILQTLIARLQNEPEQALLYAQTLQTLCPRDEQVSLEVQTLTASAQESVKLLRPQRQESMVSQSAHRDAQGIRFCKASDGVQIAFALSGSGPPILRAAHWMSHLQHDWESPVWRHWIDSISREHTLIRYDQRGNGLSDWSTDDLSLDAMVDDLASVADASGLDRFDLLGVSQSCAVSVAYAVRHPERVSHLILYGGYARGWRRRADRGQVETHEAMTTLIREGWGKDNAAFRQLFTEVFIPQASREQMAWFNDLQKKTASPLNASRLHDAFGNVDVSEILGQVAVPTLVLHARHDSAVPYEQGKALAAGIPAARFVDLNSANHILLADEPAFVDFLSEVRSFLSPSGAP